MNWDSGRILLLLSEIKQFPRNPKPVRKHLRKPLEASERVSENLKRFQKDVFGFRDLGNSVLSYNTDSDAIKVFRSTFFFMSETWPYSQNPLGYCKKLIFSDNGVSIWIDMPEYLCSFRSPTWQTISVFKRTESGKVYWKTKISFRLFPNLYNVFTVWNILNASQDRPLSQFKISLKNFSDHHIGTIKITTIAKSDFLFQHRSQFYWKFAIGYRGPGIRIFYHFFDPSSRWSESGTLKKKIFYRYTNFFSEDFLRHCVSIYHHLIIPYYLLW